MCARRGGACLGPEIPGISTKHHSASSYYCYPHCLESSQVASWRRQTRQPPVFALPRLESRYHRHGRRVPCIRSEEARKSREFYPRGISIRFSRGPEVHGLSLDFRDLHKKNSPGTGPASTTMRSTRRRLSNSARATPLGHITSMQPSKGFP